MIQKKKNQCNLHCKRGAAMSPSWHLAVALCCLVMPPPCVKNPYLNKDPSIDDDVYGGRQCNLAGFSPSIGGNGLSRYRIDFHEVEKIGYGNVTSQVAQRGIWGGNCSRESD